MAVGTSYASPLAAKTAAVLDHAIEGEVSRETLIGLLVHHAEMPVPLQAKALAPIARHMVGFGMPPSRRSDFGDRRPRHHARLRVAPQARSADQLPLCMARVAGGSRREVPWPSEDHTYLHAPAGRPIWFRVRPREHQRHFAAGAGGGWMEGAA